MVCVFVFLVVNFNVAIKSNKMANLFENGVAMSVVLKVDSPSSFEDKSSIAQPLALRPVIPIGFMQSEWPADTLNVEMQQRVSAQIQDQLEAAEVARIMEAFKKMQAS